MYYKRARIYNLLFIYTLISELIKHFFSFFLFLGIIKIDKREITCFLKKEKAKKLYLRGLNWDRKLQLDERLYFGFKTMQYFFSRFAGV